MSKKTKAKPPVEAVDEFAKENARCVQAIEAIEWFASDYRRPNEPITECVVRLLAEVQQFRADDMHRTYMDLKKKNLEALKGGAK